MPRFLTFYLRDLNRFDGFRAGLHGQHFGLLEGLDFVRLAIQGRLRTLGAQPDKFQAMIHYLIGGEVFDLLFKMKFGYQGRIFDTIAIHAADMVVIVGPTVITA